MVRYHNSLTSAVDGVLLFLPDQELDATGENTAGLTDKSFTRLGVLGENCIAFGYDTASVMAAIISDV